MRVKHHLKPHKSIVILILCLLVSSIVFANQKTDSLKLALDIAMDDTARINLQIELARSLASDKDELAILYYDKAYRASDSLGYIDGLIKSRFYHGYFFYFKKDYQKAIDYFNQSIVWCEKHKNNVLHPKVLLVLGSSYMYKGDNENANLIFLKGIEVSSAMNNMQLLGDFFKNIGILNVYTNNYNQSIDYFLKAIEIYQTINNNKGVADCYTNIGVVYNYMGQHSESIEYQKRAVEEYRRVGMKFYLAKGINNLGVSYDDLNKYDKALECYIEALSIQIELDDKKGISSCYNNIGEVYKDKGNYAKAIEFYEKSLRIDKEIEDIEGIAICQLNIGGIHFIQENYEKAHKYYGEALLNSNSINEKRIIANVLNAIGELMLKQGYYNKALSSLDQSIKLSQEIGEQSEEAKSHYLLGEVFRNQGQYADAIGYYEKAVKVHNQLGETGKSSLDKIRIGQSLMGIGYVSQAIKEVEEGVNESEKLGLIENVRLGAEILASAYAKNKNYKLAFEYSNLNKRLYDSIFTLESQKQIHIIENRFELERKEAQIQLQEIELEKQNAILYQRLILQRSLIGGIIAILIVVVLIIISYIRMHKAKGIISLQKDQITEKNEELRQGNEELRATVDTVIEQKYEIERATKELTDSIYYAQYIQKAILPKKENLSSKTQDHFVLYKPKDIVSGDFYWTTEIEGKTIIAAADCTGHGVPGAFMSMLGVSFLNDIVNKEYITHTGVILRRLRKEVINALQQKGVLGEQRDGMDIALCAIDFEKLELQFSGAHNPLYIIRSKDKEPITEVNATEYNDNILYELKGDRMPVALYEKMDRFSDRHVKLFADDRLYMFSDGFVDQFGGKDGKRFKSRAFKEVLLRNCEMNMYDQKCALESMFLKWKGNYEQIDDVMVVGLQI